MTDSFGFVDALMPRSNAPRIRQGTISAIAASRQTVSVTIGGDLTVISGVRFLESYSPNVGEAVWLVSDGQDLFVLGALATIPSGGVNANHAPFAIEAGSSVIPSGTLGTWVSLGISFTAGRFTSGITPIVAAGPYYSVANPRYFRIDGVTSSGFNAYQQQISGATPQSCGFYWIAVQMTSTSGAG